MTKSVGITGFFRQDQIFGGVHSVFENLLRGIAETVTPIDQPRDLDVSVFHAPGEVPFCTDRLRWRQVSDRWGRFAAESSVAVNAGRGLDALLFHNYHTPLIVKANRAVTIIHDLQFFHLPQFFRASRLLWLKWAHSVTLRKCDRVVTITHAVKSDILRLYGDRWDDRIDVIWNAVSINRFQKDSDDPGRDFTNGRPYLLCVAVDRPQKNLSRLVQAFAKVRQKHPDFCLVLAGQLRSWRRDHKERIGTVAEQLPPAAELVEKMGLAEHVRVTGFITDQELGALYRGATMCVQPSLFEGFGMTAVEAMAMGKPTLVSGLSAHREVTFNAAQYFDNPTDVDAMAEAIATILKAPERYRPPAEIVNKTHASFAPRNIAKQYLQVLTE